MADICTWARQAQAEALAADLVPGATAAERSCLAALGGFVRDLVEHVPCSWPEALRQWTETGPPVPPNLLNAVRSTEGSAEIFSLVYQRLVSGPHRRRLGTFFTPPVIVELMLNRAVRVLESPAQVVDPGAGVGAFSIPARERWPNAKVTAVDINVVTLGLLAAQSLLDDGNDRLELIHADYLSWVSEAHAEQTSSPKLLLGNPPYTRHQELDAKSKAAAMTAAAGLVDSGLAGLAAYFLAASLHALDDRDALCFVLPGSWTESRYGRPLRRWLWNQRHRAVELLAFPTTLDVFPGTRVTAMVLVVGPMQPKPAAFTIEQVTVDGSRLRLRRIGKQSRTTELPPTFGPLLWPQSSTQTQSVPLSTVARVRRGVATGANHFFFLRDHQIKEIPTHLVVPGLTRLRHVVGEVLDENEHDRIGKGGYPRWLLALSGPDDVQDESVKALLEEGIAAGYHDRYLARDREYWYAVEHVEPPDIIVALMTKDRFRAVVNTVKAVPSNSMYGLYLQSADIADRLCSWLNSDAGQLALRERSRHYSNGLFKLEPRDYLKVRIPRRPPGGGQAELPFTDDST